MSRMTSNHRWLDLQSTFTTPISHLIFNEVTPVSSHDYFQMVSLTCRRRGLWCKYFHLINLYRFIFVSSDYIYAFNQWAQTCFSTLPHSDINNRELHDIEPTRGRIPFDIIWIRFFNLWSWKTDSRRKCEHLFRVPFIEWLFASPLPSVTGEQYVKMESKYSENGHCAVTARVTSVLRPLTRQFLNVPPFKLIQWRRQRHLTWSSTHDVVRQSHPLPELSSPKRECSNITIFNKH